MTTHASCTAAPASQLLAVSALNNTSFAVASSGSQEQSPSTTFKPDKGGGNIASGEVLLVEAYAVMWLLALGLVLLTIVKQRRLDAQIAQLSAELERVRKQGGVAEQD